MDFFTLEFVVFLGIVFVLYYAIGFLNAHLSKHRIPQWAVLLVASLIFYGLANYVYLIYLGISFSISYLIGVLVQYRFFVIEVDWITGERTKRFRPTKMEYHEARRRWENVLTAGSIIANVGILAVLKYYNFVAGSANAVFQLSWTTQNFLVPLGISFYSFSLAAYNVDCCRRTTNAEINPLKFLLFVSYFPKILQGPISSYDQLKNDGLFKEHRFTENHYMPSLFRISIGLVKKMAVANVLGLYIDATYANIDASSGGVLAVVMVLYSIQLYCDFSGFMDIVIGISGLFGIRLEENFNLPYLSRSIQEFWRRWHITLGVWLKKCIYIPLGGSRVPVPIWALNTLVVWLVSGFWHGASWNYVLWGLFHGVLFVIFGLPKQIRKGKPRPKHSTQPWLGALQIAGTFLLVSLGWVLFRAKDLDETWRFFARMAQFWLPGTFNAFTSADLSSFVWMLVAAGVLVGLLIAGRVYYSHRKALWAKVPTLKKVEPAAIFLCAIICFSFSIFAFLYLKNAGSGGSSFIYFDF